MTRMLALTALLSVLAPVLACDESVVGNGVIVRDVRELPEFDSIEFRVAGDFQVVIGKPTPLTIEADENVLPLITTEVKDRRLIVSASSEFRSKHGVDCAVTVASLKAVTVVGSGDMRVTGLTGGAFASQIAGSGDVRLEGTTESLSVKIAGSGDTHVIGKTHTLSASISGSGDVHASDLVCDTATVSITGSGDARVSISDSLAVQIAGSGNVAYSGNPTVTKQITGSGDVKRRD